jgi:hypothetical protein
MNAPISRSLAALVAIGAVVILLLGAFSRLDPVTGPAGALPALPADSPADAAIESAGGPELPANLSPGLAEIIKLAQAHVDESVILAVILNSNQTYSPTADEILYLADLGLSQTVVAALFKRQPPALIETVASADLAPVALAKPPASNLLPTAQDANPGSFYNALAPYGSWLQVPDYGVCWQPTAETLNPDWRPYVDQGQWLYTDNGWYWQSGYSWGWAAFHYGRWLKNGRFGWVWVPDKVWGPAWVSWRIALTYSGWAPLPPGAGLAAVTGLTFNNQRVAADFGFGLPPGWFTFVSEGNFLSRNLPNYAIPVSQAAAIFTRSVTVNNYSVVNQRILNLGPGRAAIAAAAEAKTTSFSITESPARQPGLQISSDDDTQSLLALVSPEETVSALPRPSLVLPIQPAPQPLPKIHHHRMENPAYSNRVGMTHWEPPVQHEFLRRDQNGPPVPGAIPPDLARAMAASAPASSKSGK